MSAVEAKPASLFAVGPFGGRHSLKSESALAIRFPPFRIESLTRARDGGRLLNSSLTRVCAAFASEESFGPFHIKVEIEANSNHTLNKHMLSPVSYIGGKRAIAKQIIAVFPEHTTYVEAFSGGAQILFHKQPSEVEVLNDLDGEIINFFRVCQFHHEELVRYLRFMVVSRQWFRLLKASNPATLTDIQRAARYLYLLKNSFGAVVHNLNYKVNVIQPPGFNPDRLPEIIAETHKRLARVQIESLPYEKILKSFDRPTTLFYLDPPYYGRKLYNFNFEPEDFKKLAERVKALQGKFVLSLNDVPEVREIFRDFNFRDIELFYSSQQSAGRRYKEVLITNF